MSTFDPSQSPYPVLPTDEDITESWAAVNMKTLGFFFPLPIVPASLSMRFEAARLSLRETSISPQQREGERSIVPALSLVTFMMLLVARREFPFCINHLLSALVDPRVTGLHRSTACSPLGKLAPSS